MYWDEDPFRRLLRDLLALERDLFRAVEREFAPFAMPERLPIPRAAMPQYRETETEYILTIPLPGVRKEDINLYLVDDKLVLDVKSQRRQERKEKEGEFVGISAINIHQEFPLPPNADPNKIEAEYRNGLLVIRIKKAGQPTRGKRIEIK